MPGLKFLITGVSEDTAGELLCPNNLKLQVMNNSKVEKDFFFMLLLLLVQLGQFE